MACASYGLLAPILLELNPNSLSYNIIDVRKKEDEEEKYENVSSDDDDEVEEKNAKEEDKIGNKKPSKINKIIFSYLHVYEEFVKTPRICFLYDTIFFILLILLFSYMLLCKFKFNRREEVVVEDEMKANNSSFISKLLPRVIRTVDQNDSNYPKFIESFLFVWHLMYFLDECRQVRNISFKK